MAKLDWERVYFESLIARQGSQRVQSEFSHHGFHWKGLPRASGEPEIMCRHCNKRFLENRFARHLRNKHQFVVVMRPATSKSTEVLRKIALLKPLSETKAGEAFLARLRSPVTRLRSPVLTKRTVVAAKSKRSQPKRKARTRKTESVAKDSSTIVIQPRSPKPPALRVSIVELLRGKRGSK